MMAGIKHETMCMIKLMPKVACTTRSLLYPRLDRVGMHIIATINLMIQSHILFYNIIITSLKQQRLKGLYKIIQNVMVIIHKIYVRDETKLHL
jgi:hypothetical protein